MTALLLLAALCAQPNDDDRVVELHVSPAARPANPVRWRLLPGLDERLSGDALVLVREAQKALDDVLPDGPYRLAVADMWRQELNGLLLDPLDDRRAERVENLLLLSPDAVRCYEAAARCDFAGWRERAAQSDDEQRGDLAAESGHSSFALGAYLLALRARLHLQRDRPAEAVRDLGLALSLVRHEDGRPDDQGQYGTAATAALLLNLLEECQAHPRCPSLTDALALLPRPFLSPRAGFVGLRRTLRIMLPQLDSLVRDPVGTQLENHEIEPLAGHYLQLRLNAGVAIPFALRRIELGSAIRRADPAARASLRAAGYPESVVARTPAVNAAVLHALFAGEEVVARLAQLRELTAEETGRRIAALEREYSRQRSRPDDPALAFAPVLLERGKDLYRYALNIERRLDLLRAAEALRLHAHAHGGWPARLADVTIASLPDDPATLRPFVYRREGDAAVLEAPPDTPRGHAVTYRLTLRKPEARP